MATAFHNIGEPKRLPLNAVLSAIPSYPRPVIERLVARMIDHLDEEDGDPDLEDATDAEDEGMAPDTLGYASYGPGCIISDDDRQEEGSCDADDDRGTGGWLDDRDLKELRRIKRLLKGRRH